MRPEKRECRIYFIIRERSMKKGKNTDSIIIKMIFPWLSLHETGASEAGSVPRHREERGQGETTEEVR